VIVTDLKGIPFMLKRPIVFLSAVPAMLLGFALLAPSAARAMSVEEIANYKGADRQKVLEEGARKEGKAVIYTGLLLDQSLRPFMEAFDKAYPGVKAEGLFMGSAEILSKVNAERRANAVMVDVIESASIQMPAIKAGAVQPYHSAAMDKMPKEYFDPNGLFASTRISYYGLSMNTRQVNPADAPKTYEALLDPKWKGKLAWRTGDEIGAALFITNLIQSIGDAKTEEYLKKLATQNVVNNTESARALVDHIGQGEYAIGLNVGIHLTTNAKAQGAPVAVQLLEPVPGNASAIQLVKGAPHPYAAMLMIDLMLGPVGQGIMTKSYNFVTDPSMKPVEDLWKISPEANNVKTNFISATSMFDGRDRANELIEKYFK
jgi:ABC-type Fe3+ transport system substrate-binding protein